MSLKTMSVSKLKALKSQVEAAIRTKVTERRHEIESKLSELSELSRLNGSGRAKVVRAETRGIVARKVGKKPDKSPIANKPKASKPKRPTKIRKAMKTGAVVNRVAIEAAPFEVAPVEALPVTSAHANVMPADVSAAA